MLRETDIFNPTGTLPDVSQSVVPGGVTSASALAGINSGADYARAIYAAAYRPLTEPAVKRVDSLDTDPTAPTVNRAALERRAMGRKLQARMSSGSRPDNYAVPGTLPEPPLPGTAETEENGSGNVLLDAEGMPSVAGSDASGSLLGLPPPTDDPPGLFPRPSVTPNAGELPVADNNGSGNLPGSLPFADNAPSLTIQLTPPRVPLRLLPRVRQAPKPFSPADIFNLMSPQ